MANNPYERLTIAIEEASDNPADKDWVQTAFATLATNGVKAATSESAINRVIRQVAESRESATELYGNPEGWAYSKIAGWKEKGTQAFEESEPLNLKTVITYGLTAGGIFSIFFMLVYALPSNRPDTAHLGLLPGIILLGLAIPSSQYTFQRSQRRFGFVAAIGLTGLVIGAIACCLALLFAWFSENTGRYSVWWMLPVAGASSFALAYLAHRLLPEPNYAHASSVDFSDNVEWKDAFVQALRARGDISDNRVKEEISRVQEYTQNTGSNYLEEFGHPVAYARSLSEQKKVKPYRLYLHSLLMLAIFGIWGYGLYTTDDYASLTWRLPLLVVIVIGGVLETRRHYRAYRQTKAQSSSI